MFPAPGQTPSEYPELIMKKLICATIAAASVLGGPAGLAHADANVKKGKAVLVVKGKGLSVDRASGSMNGHKAGVRGRLYTVSAGVRSEVKPWKNATPVSAGGTKFSYVSWNLKGRKFPNNAWLCIEFDNNDRPDDQPCAKIHR